MQPTGRTTSSTPREVVFTDTEATATTVSGDGEPLVFEGGDAATFQAALQAVADRPGSTLAIEPGTYRFEPADEPPGVPEDSAHFNPQGLTGVTIEGNGATLIGTRPHRGLLFFLGGREITLRNLTIDYDPVPFTQGTITEVDRDRRSLTLALDDGYPSLTHPMFDAALTVAGNVHTADGRFIGDVRARGSAFKYFDAIEPRGDRTFELTLKAIPGQRRGIEPGRKLAVTVRGAEDQGPGHAIVLNDIDDVTVEGVTIRAASNMGIVAKQCRRPVIRDVTIATDPATDRLSATTGDGIHVVNGGPAPRVEDCRLVHVGDDAIVVNTRMTKVLERLDERTVAVADVGAIAVHSGDVLEVLRPDGRRPGALPPVAAVEYRQEYPETWAPGRPRTITFEGAIDDAVAAGDYLANQASDNRDFVVRNNVVRECIANPIRIAAGPGLIEGNELDGSARNGIWFRCDTSGKFAPKRWSNDVVVRGNRITRAGRTFFGGTGPDGIDVVYRPGDGIEERSQPHRNLTIVDNEIAASASLGIRLHDVAGVRVESNEMRDLHHLDYGTGRFGIELENVTDATVTGNRVTGSADRLFQFGVVRASSEVSASGNSLVLDGESRPARLVSWIPIRFAFDRTVTPSESDRSLAVRVLRLALLDGTGTEIRAVDVGGDERGARFGAGVYDPERTPDGSWRWFGGASGEAVLFMTDADLEAARTLRVHATAITDGIEATVSVTGSETDQVMFDTGEVRAYRISLG